MAKADKLQEPLELGKTKASVQTTNVDPSCFMSLGLGLQVCWVGDISGESTTQMNNERQFLDQG